MRKFKPVFALCLGLLAAGPSWAATQVNVVGLFNDKAVVVVNNGKPQTLSVGESSREGVKLIAADSRRAVLEVEGRRRELGMGQAVSVAGAPSTAASSVTLYADSAGHFFSEGRINGAKLKFLVDTGATTVAMNSGDARYAGIDFRKGQPVEMQTANGVAKGYRVVINTLKIGGLTLHQVDAVVLEGGSPPVVLLGMSALNRLEMKRAGIALTLTRKY